MNGIIVINKERGYSSFDVIAVLRGVLGMKKLGHTGTLDPEAEGVLPVCLGFATKICDHLMAQKKEYIANGKLGITTDTQDIFGTVLSERPFAVDEQTFREALAGFVGEIEQLTPMYSARKIDGVKLVDLARKGITIERSTKRVRVFEAELLSFDEKTGEYSIRILCQKGTYIRTICNDLGEKLGCGSCMTKLVRTKTGRCTIENSYTIDELRRLRAEGRITEAIVPIDAFYLGCKPFELDPAQLKSIRNGNFLEPEWLTACEEPVPEEFRYIYEPLAGVEEDRCIRVYAEGEFYAVYRRKGRTYRPLQMYHEVDNARNYALKQAAAEGCCISVGKFDGLHIGHRSLIEEMRRSGLPCTLLSVAAHPDGLGIYTEKESRSLAETLGVERFEIWPLDAKNRNMLPREFVENILIQKYHAKKIIVGEDFRFGRDRSGDAKMLAEIAGDNGIECEICPIVSNEGISVSSSEIRSLIAEGAVDRAAELLGEPYFTEGIIARGKQIGRTIGFPTINLTPSEGELYPPFGVYRTETLIRGKKFPSVTNIGDNPTVKDGLEHAITVETHIIGFSGDVYGEFARVTFLARLRGQMHFASLEELKAQLAEDVRAATCE